eukprot:1186239-Prorocentrum_minimum.AAC.1
MDADELVRAQSFEHGTLAAWLKVDSADVLGPREYGSVQAGSWKLCALTSDGVLFLDSRPETDPVRQAVYGALMLELAGTGAVGGKVEGEGVKLAGAVDDMWAWSRILTPSELRRLFTAVDYALDFHTPSGSALATLKTPAALAANASYTVAVWVKPASISGWQTILSVSPVAGPMDAPVVALSAYDGFLTVALLAADAKVECAREPCSDYVETSTRRAALFKDVWHHVAFKVGNQSTLLNTSRRKAYSV